MREIEKLCLEPYILQTYEQRRRTINTFYYGPSAWKFRLWAESLNVKNIAIRELTKVVLTELTVLDIISVRRTTE